VGARHVKRKGSRLARAYGDGTLATLLRITLPALIQARDELLVRDLIAHDVRFTQVLSLLSPRQRRHGEPGQGLLQPQ